jgi:hypothetical protein
MRSFIAVLGAVLVLASSAAPALSMPAVDSRSDTVLRQSGAPEPVAGFPAAGDTGTGIAVVVLIGAAALLTGAGIGFGAARVQWRTRRMAAS